MAAVFIGDDVKISGFVGSHTFYGIKQAIRVVFLRALYANNVSGTLSGAGVEFLRDGGGVIYDSGMGTGADMQTNKQVLAKQLSQIAMDAIADVRKVAGHEDFKLLDTTILSEFPSTN